tara:strand:- start:2961 stop:5747 length:2787 start_codon:yes stop_codon:yes gene_type:complete
MSIQLAVFPQTYLDNQILVDGTNFFGVNGASNLDSTSTGYATTLNVVLAQPPVTPNIWYKFRLTAYGTPTVATESGGDLTLNSAAVATGFGTRCGVYQRLSGLVVGQQYTAKINFAAGQPNEVFIIHIDSGITVYDYNQTNTVSLTEWEYTFTATAEDDILMISYGGNSAGNLVISEMSVTNTAQAATQWEGQVLVDLYEDEEIPLTLSVDDFKNVAEKIQSYSKDFNLPATKRNNQIFGNLFEVTRTVANPFGFNPYLKTRAVLKQNGIIIFDGMLKLIDIQNRDGEISYNVNLFSTTIALADTLKNRTFDHIDLSELEHTYNKTSIRNSWYNSTGLPLTQALSTDSYAYDASIGVNNTNVLKYPFVDWTGQILYANGSTGSSATIGTPELTRLEQAFRPFIKIKYLIDRIFSEAGYTYSSSIFEGTDFDRLFMDFNWGGDRMPALMDEVVFNTSTGTMSDTSFPLSGSYQTLPLYPFGTANGVQQSQAPATYNTTGTYANYIVETADNVLYNIEYDFTFFPGGVNQNAAFRWEYYDASITTTYYIDVVPSMATSGNFMVNNFPTHISGSFDITLNTGDRLRPVALQTAGGVPLYYTAGTVVFTITTPTATGSVLNTLRGSLNQWDFISGLLTMFNLVTLKDETDPANIIIEPYKDIFIKTDKGLSLEDRNIKHNWTNKIDEKDINLKPLNDLKKKTIFKYEEDDGDYIFNVYKKATRGHLYGSRVFSAEGLTLLEGEDEIVASPFAATVSKPLWTQFTELVVPTIYSANDDGATSSFDNAPRILYQMEVSPVAMSTTYFIPGQNGLSSENTDDFFTFSHLTDIPTVISTPPAGGDTVDFNFGECQLIPPIGESPPDNLFNIYWLPYYNQLYDPDTKVMTLKVYLQPGDIATFNFADYVMIKNRAYRVNRIDYKPDNLSTVEFILIN